VERLSVQILVVVAFIQVILTLEDRSGERFLENCIWSRVNRS